MSYLFRIFRYYMIILSRVMVQKGGALRESFKSYVFRIFRYYKCMYSDLSKF